MQSTRRLLIGKLLSRNSAETLRRVRGGDPAAAAATSAIANVTVDVPDDEDMSDEDEDIAVGGHEALEVLKQIGAIDDC